MNIAHILPHTALFPLEKHNGRYEWTLRLARIQSNAGHKVTIYAAPGSYDPESTVAFSSASLDAEDKQANNIAQFTTAFKNQHQVIHSHFDFLHYTVSKQSDLPIVFTQHWFPNESVVQAAKHALPTSVIAVAPTHFMAAKNAELGIPNTRVIHHGIDLNLFHPIEENTNRLIFVGRITPSKGVSEAVKFAKKIGEKLDIIGKINDADAKYWHSFAHLIDNEQIRYLGPKTLKEVAEHMARAKAFLFPSMAAEAFGQVTVEAQACGTPVIISDIGASSELVRDKITGFVAHNETEFCEAIKNLPSIDRKACRVHAEKFDVHTMYKAYDDLYHELID